ncbi:class I SAM-dependent methyltransferase [Solicola gregarius]|uniref:Class I SAM-dependent methyltransferase n=1 Tax=Solicola gregarius TaxID=2908642 RepID=A0AA46TGU7_9ACTN|nr:class I SAM-dependent methyltransferase [Solicola gregarius]UYM05107.1 class I SAM-dependent methyltransferase [Solicola gregarius]
MTEQAEEVRRGAAVYSKRVLGFYDVFVVRISSTYVWRCHRDRMVELYDQNLGARHLDVGPGTGWYLANAHTNPDAAITLLDMNTNSLSNASARLADSAPSTVVANVLDPLPNDIGPFDSIGANYVFHCVPGSWADKGVAFGHLAAKLASGGVLFGGTILGRGVQHNAAGRRLMAIYNGKGIFHNSDDDAEGLEDALRQHFAEVTIDIVGTVALFRAAGPKAAGT